MKSQKRKAWTDKEDKILLKIIKNYENLDWNIISQKMKSDYKLIRSSKQCRERYSNHLGPEINKENWTIEENKKLFNMHKKFGNHWTKISNYVTGRTENNIKNQFFSLLKKALRKFNKLTFDNKEYMDKILKIKPKTISLFINLKFFPNSVSQEITHNSEFFKKILSEFIDNNEEFDKNKIKEKNKFKELINSLINFDEIISIYKVEKKKIRDFKTNIKIKSYTNTNSISNDEPSLNSNKSKMIKKRISKITTNFKEEDSNLNDIDIEGIFTKSINNKVDNYFNFFKNTNNDFNQPNNLIKNNPDPYSINSTNINKKFFINTNDKSIISVEKKFFPNEGNTYKKQNSFDINENISSIIKRDNEFFKEHK